MRRLYPAFLYLGLLACSWLLGTQEVYAQTCDWGPHAITPSATSVCSGERVSVTVPSTIGASHAFRLVSDSGEPYSGYFLGTGGTLVLESNPLTASVTLQLEVSHLAPQCSTKVGNIAITVDAPPTTAYAGVDQLSCEPSFELAANTPTNGTGVWSVVSGAVVVEDFDDVNEPNTVLNNVPAGGTVRLRWTTSNGACADSFDEVVLTRLESPTTAYAGEDIEQCNNGSFTVSANNPTVGTGKWSVVSGDLGITITNENAFITSVTGVPAGESAVLRWTISNGDCPVSIDDIVLANHELPAPTLNSDVGNTVCAGEMVTFTATTGGDHYDFYVDGVIRQSGTSNIFAINTLQDGDAVSVRMTDENGCSAVSDPLVMTVNPRPVVSLVSSDADDHICVGTTLTFTATPVQSGANYAFYVDGSQAQTGAGHTFTTSSLSDGDAVWVKLTTVDGCQDTSAVIVTRVDAPPSPATIAHGDSTKCEVSTFTIEAVAPDAGTGKWEFVGGNHGAAIADVNSASTTVAGVPAGTSVTVRWVVEHEVCASSSAQVVLTNLQAPDEADAGSDQAQCANGTFAVLANNPLIGTGQWSIEPGADPGVTITNPNSFSTTVTGVPAGQSVTLRWTVTNGICSDYDFVTLTNNENLLAEISVDGNAEQCNNGDFAVTGTLPSGAMGEWSFVGPANGATVQNIVVDEIKEVVTADVTGLQLGESVTLRWTVERGACETSTEVTLTNKTNPTDADAGPDQDICNASFFTLAASDPAPGIGLWTIETHPTTGTVSITNSASPTTTVTGLLPGQSVELRWTVMNGACTSSDLVTLTNSANLPLITAGPDQEKCMTGDFTVTGVRPAGATGKWTYVTAPNGASIIDDQAQTTTVTGLEAGKSVTLRWTVKLGACISSADVTLTNSMSPLPANAGSDQDLCNVSSFTMAASDPGAGSGLWTIVGGSGAAGIAITNPTSRSTTVTGLQPGRNATLKWTVENGSCKSTDEVTLTHSESLPLISAGADRAQCQDGNFTVTGTLPAGATGVWSIVEPTNGAKIEEGTETNATVDVTGLQAGQSVKLRWTVERGACEASAEVVLTNKINPALANAGPDQDLCNTSFFTMAASDPGPGTGLWTIDSGFPVTITNPASRTTTVTGLPPGESVTLRWRVTNDPCTSSDEVTLTHSESLPLISAGADRAQCQDGNFTVTGTLPAGATGVWSIVEPTNGAEIEEGTETNATVDVTGLQAGQSVKLRWTVERGACEASAEVVLTNKINPALADAGPDQDLCNTSFFTMAASDPGPGTGLWTIDSGFPVTITNPASPTTTVTGLPPGESVTLSWTVTNDPCTSIDEVTLTHSESLPLISAGADQAQCQDGNFIVTGTLPAGSTGVWSIVGPANGATVQNAVLNPLNEVGTAEVTGLQAGQSVKLRWTVERGACEASAEVVLTNKINPAFANAGPDQDLCNTSFFTMAASDPGPGTGLWTIDSGFPVTITNPASRTTTVTGLPPGESVTLRWTVTNDPCTSTDEVTLTHSETLPLISAGADQAQCQDGDFTVTGTLPAGSTGVWSIVGPANGAEIEEGTETNATVDVTGLQAGQSVKLRWTVTRGTCVDHAEVTLTNKINPLQADAGPDQDLCNASFFTMAASDPGPGIGLWTIDSGFPVTITNPASPTTTVTGLPPGESVTLSWTVTNNPCTSDDLVVLTNTLLPTLADAGEDQQICGASTTLAANTPALGTGEWSIISGDGGNIVSLTSPTSEFSGVSGNTYILRWTTTNGVCIDYDDVSITFKRIPDVDASDETICAGTTTDIEITNPNGVPGTTYHWTVLSATNVNGYSDGNGDRISQQLFLDNRSDPGLVVYRITPTASGCTGDYRDVTVIVNPTPVITTTATDLTETVCSGEALNFLPSSSVTGTTYEWIASVSGTITGVDGSGNGIINHIPVNAGNTAETITYTITPHAGACAGSPVNYVVTVLPRPTVAADDQTICSGSSTAIAISNPNSVAGTTYSWTVNANNVSGAQPGTGSTISQVLAVSDDISPGAVIYTITPYANGCAGTPVDVTVNVTPVTVITNTAAELSRQICSGVSLNFEPTSTVPGTMYKWKASFTGPLDPGTVTTSGSGAIEDTPINTGNTDAIVTYAITPHFDGCDGDSVNLVVVVKPLPSASASDLTICSGQPAFVEITPSPKGVAGTTFSWTHAVPTGNVTGAIDGNGSIINQVLSTTDASIGKVQYTISPMANGCVGAPIQIVTTVNPVATVEAENDFAVCEPGTIPVTGTIGGSASSATWTIISGNGTVSGSTRSGNQVTTTYTVDPDDIGATVRLRLTTDDPDMLGPCSAVADSVEITINRAPRVSVPADFVICEQNTLTLSGNLAGSSATGSWSVVPDGDVGRGLLSVSSITGGTVTANYSPTPEDIDNTVAFRLTSNDPDGFGPCEAATGDLQITINRAARIDAGAPIDVCEDQIVSLSAVSGGATSSVMWTGGTGVFEDPGDPQSKYHLTQDDINAGTITLTLTTNDPDGAGPCTPVSDDVSVRINRLPFVEQFWKSTIFPENAEVQYLEGRPLPGVFTGPGITAGTNEFHPANAGIGTKTITYTHTDVNGCVNSASINVTVNPLTDVDFTVEQPSSVDELGRLVICQNSGNNNLLRLVGIPEWNDPEHITSDNSSSFVSLDPRLRIFFDDQNYYINTRDLPEGVYPVQYIFYNKYNAETILTKHVVVNAAPKAVIDVPNSCIDEMITFTDQSFIPSEGSASVITEWAWTYGEGGNGNDGVSRNPIFNYTSEGFKTLRLRVRTDHGCQHDTTKVIRVSNPPKPDFTWSKICVQTETTEFKDLSDPGIGNIIQYAWDFNDGDSLGYGLPNKMVATGKHEGRTSNSYKDPHHRYADFKVYNVKLSIRTDDGCENSVTKRVYILDYGKPTPISGYYENFESGKGTWVQTSSHMAASKADTTSWSWRFGTPSGETINSAFSGKNAWWTGGNTNAEDDFSTYYPNDSTEVTGPCLDLTGIERPMISLNYWSDSQREFDGAVVQYSTNGGTTWRTIGDAEKRGINWYNSKNLPASIGGEDRFAWTGESGGWKNARFSLDEIPPAERKLVVFRIAFGSNSDNLSYRVLNGFAFDDVYIGEKKRTVLVEHFTNSSVPSSHGARAHLDELYANQLSSGLKARPDFFKLQYHIAAGGFDQLNADNPNDPASRAFVYQFDYAPTTVMDGLLGRSPYRDMNGEDITFTGEHSKIDNIELERRALDDPKFLIDGNFSGGQSEDEPLSGLVTFTYTDSMNQYNRPVIFHAALVEANIEGNRNVVRRLLWGGGGRTETRTWTEGTQLILPIEYNIDVPITDPDNLYVVAFVQDKDSREILQSAVFEAPRKVGMLPVGVEDNPFIAEIGEMKIFPNPASKAVNFALDNVLSHDYTYRIIDQRGVTILEGALERDLRVPQEVELDVLSNGIYFVQFRNHQNKVVIYRKLAVMNRQ